MISSKGYALGVSLADRIRVEHYTITELIENVDRCKELAVETGKEFYAGYADHVWKLLTLEEVPG